MESKTQYARNGDVHLAYRVFGDGPRDILLVPGTISHVELYWELSANLHLLRRLASFARVIVFDKRGQGLSDRVAEQTIEERVDDLRAVMDAAGSQRATIYGWSEGGQMSLTFAASHPERTTGLVLYGTYAAIEAEPWRVSPERFARFLSSLAKHWGEGILAKINPPSRIDDEDFVRSFGRLERAVASPGAILALMRANCKLDVRQILPSIRVPALVLHRRGDALIPVDRLFQQAMDGTPDPGWDFEPDAVVLKKGSVLSVVDQGGEPHTFTEVGKFGGGFVEGLNHGEPTVPECDGAFANFKVARTRILQGSHLEVTDLPKGKHLFQCCIHPWMRVEVDAK